MLLWISKVLRNLARHIEVFALAYIVRRTVSCGPWWSTQRQQIKSAATNTNNAEPNTYTWGTVYQENHDFLLPYPSIVDDTESIAGMVDLVRNGWVKPGAIVLNLGGGRFDVGPIWIENQVSNIKVLTADPFRRTVEHNLSVQTEIEAAGGADVVMSISVLNVIKEVNNRVEHAVIAHRSMKDGGLAYFKVWAGCWPARGLGNGIQDLERGTYQLQRWADAYLLELEAVFGVGQVFADNTTNLLIAVKKA